MPADHPDKAREGGSQSTPGEFIDWLLDVAEACARVLAPHGSLCIELGDTYSGTGGAGGDWSDSPLTTKARVKGGSDAGPPRRSGLANYSDARGNPDGMRDTTFSGGNTRTGGGSGWPLAKSLSLIPESFRWAMVYGRNPHTGRTTEPWRLRNVIRWVRPNPPVGALGDKFRPATSELMVFCKSAKRFFDLDAVREPFSNNTHPGYSVNTAGAQARADQGGRPRIGPELNTHSGAPPLDWWNIPLLEGEEETRYGPKAPKPWGPRHYYGSAEKGVGNQTKSTDEGEHRLIEGNPAGAPPLDWWKIPRESNLRSPCQHGRYEPHRISTGAVGVPLGAPIEWHASECLGGKFIEADGAPLDWWEIPPGGYEGAHYAVFPPELCVKPVKAMSPEKVCRQCGEPSRRISEVEFVPVGQANPDEGYIQAAAESAAVRPNHNYLPAQGMRLGRAERRSTTTGWTDCGHDDWRPGMVLDPFVGSGTTLMVATGHGRDAIGIDLDSRNFDLALERVGPFILTRGDDD